MKRSFMTLLGAPVLVAALALSAGCATTKQLDEVRAMAEEAQRTADEAMAMAEDASARADEANERTMETDRKIDEMFKKTMEK